MQVVSVLWLLKDSELTLSFSQGKKRGNMEILVNRDSPIVLNELENFSPLAVSPSVKFVR